MRLIIFLKGDKGYSITYLGEFKNFEFKEEESACVYTVKCVNKINDTARMQNNFILMVSENDTKLLDIGNDNSVHMGVHNDSVVIGCNGHRITIRTPDPTNTALDIAKRGHVRTVTFKDHPMLNDGNISGELFVNIMRTVKW